MKNFRVFLFCLMLTSVSALAQYNNPFGSSRITRSQYDAKPAKLTPEAIEKNKNERIEKIITNLKTELSLDDLQVIAIRNEILSNSKDVDIVMKKENSEEEKSKEITAMMERTENKIISYLSNTQKEKYRAMIVAAKSGKKDKKGKKEDHKEDLKPEEEIKQ